MVALETPSVLKELDLTAEQKTRLKEAKVEAGRMSEQIGRENRLLRRRLTATGDREGLASMRKRTANSRVL